MSFGENLKKAIKERGYDMDEVAIELDFEASTIYSYSGDYYFPQFENLREICNRYIISPNELFDGLYKFNDSEAPFVFKISYLLSTLEAKEKNRANQIIDAFVTHLAHAELKSFGSRIKALRKQRKHTVKYLSQIINLAPSTISNIEANTSNPSVASLLAFADVFHVSPDYLLSDTVNIPSMSRFAKLLPAEIALLYKVLSIEFEHE